MSRKQVTPVGNWRFRAIFSFLSCLKIALLRLFLIQSFKTSHENSSFER
jgi:hypothetical protein